MSDDEINTYPESKALKMEHIRGNSASSRTNASFRSESRKFKFGIGESQIDENLRAQQKLLSARKKNPPSSKDTVSQDEPSIGVKVISHSDYVFQQIRKLDGLNEQELIQSLDFKKNRKQIFKSTKGEAQCSGGKSNSFFFKTYDEKYIIKILKKSEVNLYLDILPYMLTYFQSNSFMSYIMRIYGIYTITVKSFRPVHVMI